MAPTERSAEDLIRDRELHTRCQDMVCRYEQDRLDLAGIRLLLASPEESEES